MAVSFDAAAVGATGTNAQSITFTHVVASGGSLIAFLGANDITVTASATFNGVAADATTTLRFGIGTASLWMFTWLTPTSGSHSVVATISGINNRRLNACSMSFLGVGSFGTPVTSAPTSTVASVSVTVSEAATSMVANAFYKLTATAATAGGSQTSEENQADGTNTKTIACGTNPGTAGSVTPSWSWTGATDACMIGVEIKASTLVVNPFINNSTTFELPNRGPSQFDRGFTQNMQIQLLGLDKLPQLNFDQPLPKVAYQFNRGFTQSTQDQLIGQDKFYDSPGMGPPNYDWPLPIPPYRQAGLRSWTQSLQLDLLGQDQFPFRQMDWPLPTPPAREPSLRTALQGPLQDVVVPAPPLPFNQYDWPLPTPPYRQPDLRTWAWPTPIQLIGQDKLPFNQFDWPLPGRFVNPFRSGERSLQLDLLGQDQLPFNQYDHPLPKTPFQFNRGYLWPSQIQLIGKDQLPLNQYDWPLPGRFIAPYRSWEFGPTALTMTPVKLPFNQYDWPIPKTPFQFNRGYTWPAQLQLIGKDKLPLNPRFDFPLPGRPYYDISLRTWTLYPPVLLPKTAINLSAILIGLGSLIATIELFIYVPVQQPTNLWTAPAQDVNTWATKQQDTNMWTTPSQDVNNWITPQQAANTWLRIAGQTGSEEKEW